MSARWLVGGPVDIVGGATPREKEEGREQASKAVPE